MIAYGSQTFSHAEAIAQIDATRDRSIIHQHDALISVAAELRRAGRRVPVQLRQRILELEAEIAEDMFDNLPI